MTRDRWKKLVRAGRYVVAHRRSRNWKRNRRRLYLPSTGIRGGGVEAADEARNGNGPLASAAAGVTVETENRS